ncbi:hypothetical protein C1H46_016173 [Malus baccata]|uniref:Uncharacterized protein n=1 Tax=Malus baccata TaxID=106549 RepID=A0A540MID6_MALBA|nr:hypothetical protein C1H46_016173 [Malus baccata]
MVVLRVQGKGYEKVDKKKKRDALAVRYSFGGSRYRINYKELIVIQKLDKCNKFMCDMRVLVRNKCSVDWESWRAVPEEIKTHLIDELEPDWDIDQSDPNLMKCIDNLFKSSFWEWKFDVEHKAELNRIPEPPVVE